MDRRAGNRLDLLRAAHSYYDADGQRDGTIPAEVSDDPGLVVPYKRHPVARRGAVTASCPSCRADLPEDARFCPACGTRLDAGGPEATERKVVTTLFADLVGFTAMGERHDPEDLDAALRGFYGLARTIVERFGGTVEKFIGDAVVGLFGVPAAHEDDAERAVRAALELVAHLHELPPVGEERLQVRCAVNTGPALVRLDARPETGEGVLVGDAVNTCARLLSEAPAMGVVAGDVTQRLSSQAIAYEALAPTLAKGKSSPVARWLALGPISRRGVDLDRVYGAPLVGREVELGMLKGMFAQVCSSKRPRLAVLIGEAGVGKTRLIFELARWIDREPNLFATWRQGCCLPYGESSGFHPLAEVVKLQCGIRDGDDDETVAGRIGEAVAGDADGEWISDRLRALVGATAAPAEQDENFAAWEKFLDLVAQKRPMVIFLDDLHWADDALLDFLEYLLRDGCTAPLLLLGAARPELLQLRPGFAEHLGRLSPGDSSAVRIDLVSLPRDETERLVAALSSNVETDLASVIVERSGGNPFYVEELVRLFSDRDRGGDEADWSGFESLPDSLQALLTARLDLLEVAPKAVLADAAVAGQEFPIDLIAAMGCRSVDDVRRLLDELAVREFVRPANAGRESPRRFAFWHALTRDAAYAELPRAVRAAKHIAAARWHEGELATEADEAVTAVAHHYVTAFDLLSEMGDRTQMEEIRSPAATALRRAGDGALRLDARTARDHYARAVSLMEEDDPQRPQLTVALAESSIRLGDLDTAMRQLETGISQLEAAGDRRAAAVALTRLSNVVYWREMGGAGTAALLTDRALELLAGDDPSPELMTVLEERAVQCSRNLEPQPSIAFANEAIAMSTRLGLPLPLRALAYRGAAQCDAGVASGVEDIRLAYHAATERGEILVADSSAHLLADGVYAAQGPEAGLEVALEALADAVRRREHLTEIWFRNQVVQFYRLSGRWGDALDEALPLEQRLKKRESLSPLHDVRWDIAQIRLHQGELAEAERLLDWCEKQYPFHPFVRLQDLGVRAALCSALDDCDGARRALSAYEELSRGRCYSTPVSMTLPQVLRAAVQCDAEGIAESITSDLMDARLLERSVLGSFRGQVDMKAGRRVDAADRLGDAAELWRRFGDPFEEALALLDRGQCLVALGETTDAVDSALAARKTFARLGANPSLVQADALLHACGLSQPA